MKSEDGFRSLGRTRKSRPGAPRQASPRRNVRRKITASAVLLSLLFLTFPFTLITQAGLARENVEAQGGLPQQDIDAVNALAAFNIGASFQSSTSQTPGTSQPGVVVAQAIGQDPSFPPLFVGPLKSVKELLPLIREAAARRLQYEAGGTKTVAKPLPPPYARKTYTAFVGRFGGTRALVRCEKEEGVGNCEEVKPNPRDAPLAYPKCKPGFTASGDSCNPIPDPNAWSPSPEAVNAVIRQAASDPKEKMKLAPFMLQVAWEALATLNPTPAQRAFYQYFQFYAGWQNQIVTQKTLVQWCKHKKNWPKSPASVLIGTDNAKSAGFKPTPIPMSIGPNGYLAMDQFLTPAIVTDMYRRDPNWKIDDLIADGKPLDTVLTQLGFTGPSAAAVMTSMLGDLPDGWPGSKLPMLLKAQKTLESLAPLAGRTALTVGLKLLGKLIGEVIGYIVAGVGIPLSIIAVALEIMIKNIMAEIETPKFEAALVKGSREVQPVDVRGLIYISKQGYGDSMKIGVMSHLVKMMIVDPADGTAFGPSLIRVLDPFEQLNPNDACSGLEQQGLLQ